MTGRVVLQLIARRSAQAVGIALVLATLCFAFIHLLPGDLSLRIAAARLGEDRVTIESAERIRREEGLDRPLVQQYAEWMGRVAKGDLGVSLVSRKTVGEELNEHIRYTLTLGLVALFLSYLIALPVGVAAGLKPGGLVDRCSASVAVVLAAFPSFLVGLGLITVFAIVLKWLPPAGYRTMSHIVLPALTLALGLAAYSVRVIRNAVAEVRGAFFMTYARIKGLRPHEAFMHHGVRNAAVPVVTYAALQFAFVIDGFVVIETLFNYPGVGDLLVKSLLARDIPVVMGAGLLFGLTFAVVNFFADLATLWLDPRTRRAAA
jgi:peptide/nickel transport system permease protein